MSRPLSEFLKGGAQPVTMCSGEVTVWNGTTRIASVTIGGAPVKVWVPSSFGTLIAGDSLFMLRDGNHLWPVSYDR